MRVCTTCDARLDTIAARRTCEAAGHPITVREQPIWWIRYTVNGQLRCESARSEDRQVAEDLLQTREGPLIPARPVPATVGPVTFADAAAEIVADYQMNKKRSLRTLSVRIEKHLRPAFGKQPLAAITTPVVRTYIRRRQAEGASNATINRDLITLKRMFTLAVQGGKLLTKPYIPLLKEQNVRRGFFEPEEFQRIKGHLPDGKPAPMRTEDTGLLPRPAPTAGTIGANLPAPVLPPEAPKKKRSFLSRLFGLGKDKN